MLPPMTAAVNAGPQFAPLRRVYLSRVAAESGAQWPRPAGLDGAQVGPADATIVGQCASLEQRRIDSPARAAVSLPRRTASQRTVTRTVRDLVWLGAGKAKPAQKRLKLEARRWLRPR